MYRLSLKREITANQQIIDRPFWVTVICGASIYWLVPRSGMFEVLSVEKTDENCEFSSFALVFGSPCKFPFSFRGAIPEFSHFLFLMINTYGPTLKPFILIT
jgi:hypothetical protein